MQISPFLSIKRERAFVSVVAFVRGDILYFIAKDWLLIFIEMGENNLQARNDKVSGPF